MKMIKVPTGNLTNQDLAYYLYKNAEGLLDFNYRDFNYRWALAGASYRGTTPTFMHAHMIREELSDESRMRWRMPSIESITGSPVQEF